MDTFKKTYTSTGMFSLPPQMIPLSEKSEDWGKECMDRLEAIGKGQHYENLKLIENYEMIKGKFMFKHYLSDEQYADMISQLTDEFALPNYLRHYDITSQIINTLSGEWQKRPDTFRVKSYGERYENDFLRAKTEMITNYIQYNINNEINRKLLEMGIDPNRQDFASPEEQQQYLQLVEQQKQVLTPPEIEQYMATKWRQIAEIWGQHQLEFDKQRFNLAEKEKIEFEDMLIADRCFRHFYITGDSYNQETWNPVNVFFHKSPEVEYVEDGDYVGRVFYMTISDIIDKYGWMMPSDVMDKIRGGQEFNSWKDKDGYGIKHGSVVPYQDYPQAKVFIDTIGYDPMTSMGIPTVGEEFFKAAHQGNYSINTAGLLQVTEAYWKSQKKIGKVVYLDDSGVLTKTLVDENFIVPKNFKEVTSSIYDSDEINTVSWTWINEVWQGIKISGKNSRFFEDDIYLNIKPLEFQFKGDLNPYNAKLPVCGQVFSSRNSKSMSLVDLVKPDQVGHNVAMNQLYQIMEREVGRFIVMDVNMFPALKDWGGERAWDKFMLVAKSLGMAPIDTTPANINQASAANGGYFPKDINLDESARMVSRMKIAEFFEQRALKQVGFNDYRLGSFSSESTAAGIEQGSRTSYAQTETYFTKFSNYLRRCYTMNLDIAQYVQSKKDDVRISYIKSDLSRAFTSIAGTDLLGVDMGIYVSNNQEQMRQLESIRSLALTNNTSGATPVDLADIIFMNSPQEIRQQLQESYNKTLEREDRKIQIEQQRLQFEEQKAQEETQLKLLMQERDLQSKENVARMNAVSRIQDRNSDGSTVDIDYEKLGLQADNEASKRQLDLEKHILEKERLIAEKQHAIDKLAIDKRKIEANIEIENKKIQVAKIMKGKDDKNSSKKK